MIRLPEEPLQQQLRCDASAFISTDEERRYYAEVVRRGLDDECYQVQDIVNVGGTGLVLRVFDQQLRRPLAMKLLLPSRKHAIPMIADFVKEAKIHGWLEHPYIIPLYEFGWLEEIGLFFTMSLVPGETLKAFLLRAKQGQADALRAYSPYRLLRIFRKVCDAVAYAHSMGITHQDIKPDNVMIGPYGEVFLLDWGAAAVIGNPAQEDDPARRRFWRHLRDDVLPASSSSVGRLQGTPSFMSPEQASGQRVRLDERSDIFLLGATLYTMFTLKLPYNGKSVNAVLQKARQGHVRPPQLRSPERQIPDDINRIIMKAMQSEPKDRYQHVCELAADLDEILGGRLIPQEIREFQTGEMVVREGEAGTEAYMLLQGTALVTRQRDDTRVVLGVSQRGDIVGEMALISDEPRSATVQALEPVAATVLTKDMLDHHLRRLPPYIREILNALTHRLHDMDSMVHPYMTSDCTAPVLKQLRLLLNDCSGGHLTQASVNVDALVDEISHDLGIPVSKVMNVLVTAHHLRLLQISVDRELRVPNIDKLTEYANRARTDSAAENADTPQERGNEEGEEWRKGVME